jgi:ankyrin repeat protein
LLESEETEIDAMTYKGVTPLMNATASNCLDVVKFLVSKNAEPYIVDGEGTSCLDRALENDNTEIFQFLLKLLDPNRVHSFEGWTIAHTCAKNGQTNFLKLLIEDKRCLFKATDYGITPLHLACQEGHFECVKMLAELQDSPSIDCKANDGITPIFIAAQNGHIDTLKYLIEYPADVTVITPNGTVLHSAVIGGNQECLELLLNNGADVEGAVGKTEVETPLCQAVFNNDIASIKTLLRYGADPLCCSTDPYSSTPLHLSFQSMQLEEEDTCETVKLLVSHVDSEKVVNAVAEELILVLKDSDNLEFLKKLLCILNWKVSKMITCSVVAEIVSTSRVKCLAFLLSCNYLISDIVISDSVVKYFIDSTAGVEHKHLIHQALYDHYLVIPRSFYYFLCQNLTPVTANPIKEKLLELIDKQSNEPRPLVDWCRFKIRRLISCRADFAEVVDSLELNQQCKEVLLLERKSTVSPKLLQKCLRTDFATERQLERQYMVM